MVVDLFLNLYKKNNCESVVLYRSNILWCVNTTGCDSHIMDISRSIRMAVPHIAVKQGRWIREAGSL